ncbi:hypothetical protein HD554DRAFT_2170745 [Boletus coccyginus]|nr:hypothetical protein HD554DRAFT_2170745 [Boletus coccyginus]
MAPPRASTAVVCDVCHKTINRKADLPRHMKTHAENKEALMHACDHPGCTYKTLQRSNLLTHLDVHLRQRRHKCPEEDCGFRCTDPGSLTRHRRGVHGYQPDGSHSSASGRKAARQRRKISPYSTSSSTRSVGAGSPSDSSSNAHPSPSSFLSFSNEQVEGSSKNAWVEYNVEPIAQHAQVNDLQLAFNPYPENAPSFTSGSGVLTVSEEPVADHPQLLIPEQGDLYAVDAASQSISETTVSGDDFYAQFDDIPSAGPSLPKPVVAYGVDDFSPALFPSPVPSYTVDDALVPTPASWTLPSFDAHYAANNEPPSTAASLPAQPSFVHPQFEVQYTLHGPSNYEYYGYTHETEAAAFDAQFNSDSWATPDMSVGIYPQVSYPRTVGVDQGYETYPYTTTTYPATAESTFGMHGLYA